MQVTETECEESTSGGSLASSKKCMAEYGGYWDGFVNGDDSFHNVINMLDFPLESVEGDNSVNVEDWEAQFHHLGPIPLEFFQGIDPVSQANIANNFVPSDATSELKKQPDVTEISSSSKTVDSSTTKESSFFQTTSPISVLESSSSCSAEKSMSTCPDLLIPVRTRTKIPRHSTRNKWHLISPIIPSKKILNGKGKEKKKKKLSELSVDSEIKENSSHQHIPSKRCTHCQITKTPQWREGPMGPKTLCNACGVRYRSGRLLPEYRPAASPTFVPSLHSNSHKKVIQMRNQSIQESLMPEMDPAMSPPPEFVPMSSYLFDRI